MNPRQYEAIRCPCAYNTSLNTVASDDDDDDKAAGCASPASAAARVVSDDRRATRPPCAGGEWRVTTPCGTAKACENPGPPPPCGQKPGPPPPPPPPSCGENVRCGAATTTATADACEKPPRPAPCGVEPRPPPPPPCGENTRPRGCCDRGRPTDRCERPAPAVSYAAASCDANVCARPDDGCGYFDLTPYGQQFVTCTERVIKKCACVKFNGLQDSCKHPACCIRKGCLDKPFPTCPPARKWRFDHVCCRDRMKKKCKQDCN